MDILTYLLELLLKSNEVGLTGLGTFYKKKFPGRYDKDARAFLPPGYALLFTQEVRAEDILPQYISVQRHLSVDSASYFLEEFVKEIHQNLETEHESILENLGRLFYTEHDGLSFEPARKVYYGSEFYGLPTLQDVESPSAIKPAPALEVEQTVPPLVHQAPEVASSAEHPVVENIELDEVQDDLKNTLHRSAVGLEKSPASEPADAVEENNPVIVPQEVPVPEAVKAQHEAHPHQFGHVPEAESQNKTYVNLHPAETVPEVVIEAPEFIKDQHAAHPHRFGHDPLLEVYEEEVGPSVWPKILIILAVLLFATILLYFFKPTLFGIGEKPDPRPAAVALVSDSGKNELVVDSVKFRQDSIAKTDSILKVNQVQKGDTLKKQKPLIITPVKPVGTTGKKAPATLATSANDAGNASDVMTYEIIGASFETVKAAEKFIREAAAKGVRARIVKLQGPRKKVSVGSFKTEKEASDNLAILEKKLDGSGFYIQQQINLTP